MAKPASHMGSPLFLVTLLLTIPAITIAERHGRSEVPASRQRPEVSACRLVDLHGLQPLQNGTLSPMWAQEAIGADLTRSIAAQLKESGKLRKARVTVMDTEFNDSITGRRSKAAKQSAKAGDVCANAHGANVCNLINGDSPIGVATNAKLVALVPHSYQSDHMAADADAVIASKPDVVNASLVYSAKEKPHYVRIARSGALMVMASGNFFDRGVGSWHPPSASQGDFDKLIIHVGSANPRGYLSHFSDEDQNVDILAPSDTVGQSIGSNKGTSSFGGTSGAAPLVTASLALVTGILGRLNSAAAKLLLKKTALPTVNAFQNPPTNGSGSLNQYKLVAVTRRLLDRGWPQNKENLLQETSLYNFTDDARKLAQQGLEWLRSDKCDEKKRGFNTLREAFFLDPENASMRQEIANVYQQQGLSTNAAFYSNFDRKKLLADLSKSIRSDDDDTRKSAVRTAALVPEGVPILTKVMDGSNVELKVFAMKAATQLLEKAEPLLAQGMSDANDTVRATAVRSLGALGKRGTSLFRRAFREPNLASAAAQALEMAPPDHLPLLEELAADTKLPLSEELGPVFRKYGAPALALIANGTKSPSAAVRKHAAGLAAGYGGKDGSALLLPLIEDSDPEIRQQLPELVRYLRDEAAVSLARALLAKEGERWQKVRMLETFPAYYLDGIKDLAVPFLRRAASAGEPERQRTLAEETLSKFEDNRR